VTGHAGALATLGAVAELVAQLREVKDRAGDQRFDS
jgi:hypothetical protein